MLNTSFNQNNRNGCDSIIKIFSNVQIISNAQRENSKKVENASYFSVIKGSLIFQEMIEYTVFSTFIFELEFSRKFALNLCSNLHMHFVTHLWLKIYV